MLFNLKKSTLFLAVIAFCSLSIGSYGGYENYSPFMLSGVGARPIGMAGAFVAISGDAASTVWNPAGISLPKESGLTLTLSTKKLGFDRQHNFVGVVRRLNRRSSLGISLINFKVDDINERYSDDVAGKKFDYSTTAFSVSYGHSLFSWLDVGATLRVISDRFGIDDGSDKKTGLGGIDIGILGKFSSGINYGVAMKNLGASTSENVIPMVLELGVALSLENKHSAIFAFDLVHEFVDLQKSSTSAKIGAEYLIGETFAIRGGTTATTDRLGLHGGFGVNVVGLGIDYAFESSDAIAGTLGDSGNTHLVSLSYGY